MDVITKRVSKQNVDYQGKPMQELNIVAVDVRDLPNFTGKDIKRKRSTQEVTPTQSECVNYFTSMKCGCKNLR